MKKKIPTQVWRIYFASFLKNQTYFVPILVIFFQDLGLSFSEIFWLFTFGSVFSFIIEIPTGVFADLFGKRRSIIWSKFVIFVSFILFGFAWNFWTLLLANLILELGKSLRSGTETAYVYDYLDENPEAPRYTTVKANQKFYARISESIAAAVGGFVATITSFNFVFFVAAIPALLNFVQTLFWVKIKESNDNDLSIKKSISFAKQSLLEVVHTRILRRIIFNIAVFTSALFALSTFIQPYLVAVGVPISWIGMLYSGFLLLIAFIVRYVSKLEDRFGSRGLFNWLALISFVPILVLGLGLQSIWGGVFFFFVLMVENIRSPIANAYFHEQVTSTNRATMGSILELFKTAAKLVVLPMIGYATDVYSMPVAFLIIGGMVLSGSIFLWVGRKQIKKRENEIA